MQRLHRMIDQHLVHDNLKEKGCDQRNQLQDKGSDQHLAQQFAIFNDGRNEPGEVETRRLTGETGFAGQKDQVAGPLFEKMLQRNDLRWFARSLDQRAWASGSIFCVCASIDFGQYEKPSFVVQSDTGQGGLVQPFFGLAYRTRAKTDSFRGP